MQQIEKFQNYTNMQIERHIVYMVPPTQSQIVHIRSELELRIQKINNIN